MRIKLKRKQYERIHLHTVTYGSQIWSMRIIKRQKVNVPQMKSLSSMAGGSKRDRIKNIVISFKITDVKIEMAYP